MSKSGSILITGGAGFIGTHLGRKLAQSGRDVRVLDLVSPSNPTPGVKYIQADIRDLPTIQSALKDVTAVFHFAAIASVQRCQEEPEESYRTNLLSTAMLLQAMLEERKRSGTAIRLTFSGTSAVYGEGTGRPADEAQPLSEPLSFYAAQKLGSEQAIRLFCRNQKIPAVVFRFFNVYGPGQDPSSPYSGVISVFAKRAREGLPLRLNGGGTQTRDFVAVSDVVDACVKALGLEASRCDGAPINIASGKSITIQELANLVNRALGGRSVIESSPAREGDIQNSSARIDRARQLLGWEPRVSLENGLEALLSSF